MLIVLHFNICFKSAGWYWKSKLRNDSQNPTYYSRSTRILYFKTVIYMWELLHQIMWRKCCDKQAHCLFWNLYVSASHFLKDLYRGFQLFLDAFQMLPVPGSFVQHDPVLQHSTEFSGLGASSNYNSLAEFYDWLQAKISFFQVRVSHCGETCKQVNKKAIYLYQRNTL